MRLLFGSSVVYMLPRIYLYFCGEIYWGLLTKTKYVLRNHVFSTYLTYKYLKTDDCNHPFDLSYAKNPS